MELFLILCLCFISYSPLSLILMFVVYLMLVVVLLIYILNSCFYSFLMFLLFISGLLVMFMYLCSVILNEKLNSLNFSNFLFLPILVFVMSFGDLEIIYVRGVNMLFYEFYNLIKFFLYPHNLFSLFFILYLFLSLMVVYELLKGGKGPLRSMI